MFKKQFYSLLLMAITAPGIAMENSENSEKDKRKRTGSKEEMLQTKKQRQPIAPELRAILLHPEINTLIEALKAYTITCNKLEQYHALSNQLLLQSIEAQDSQNSAWMKQLELQHQNLPFNVPLLSGMRNRLMSDCCELINLIFPSHNRPNIEEAKHFFDQHAHTISLLNNNFNQ